MAKKYLLEPTELPFYYLEADGFFGTEFDGLTPQSVLDYFDLDGVSSEEEFAEYFGQCKVESIIDGTTMIYNYARLASTNFIFVPEGTVISDSAPSNFVGFVFKNDSIAISIGYDGNNSKDKSNLTKITPTEPDLVVTLSIYTGTDDPEPTPSDDPEPEPSSNDISRNFSFSDHSRNDMDGIADIMDDLLGLNEKEPDPEPEPVTPDDEGGGVQVE